MRGTPRSRPIPSTRIGEGTRYSSTDARSRRRVTSRPRGSACALRAAGGWATASMARATRAKRPRTARGCTATSCYCAASTSHTAPSTCGRPTRAVAASRWTSLLSSTRRTSWSSGSSSSRGAAGRAGSPGRAASSARPPQGSRGVCSSPLASPSATATKTSSGRRRWATRLRPLRTIRDARRPAAPPPRPRRRRRRRRRRSLGLRGGRTGSTLGRPGGRPGRQPQRLRGRQPLQPLRGEWPSRRARTQISSASRTMAMADRAVLAWSSRARQRARPASRRCDAPGVAHWWRRRRRCAGSLAGVPAARASWTSSSSPCRSSASSM
mmetsp:Transcript_29709/g.76799  ORF Transcript_29709/g.76799 Transcript_29709/m.76799 type:complete len:325 (-) Transcript_29709:209-1183(-)